MDQVSKVVIRESIDAGDRIHLLPGLELVNVHNSGVAFGLLANGGAVILIVTSVAIVALIFFLIKNLSRPFVWLPTGLLLGGALGNAIDRIRADSVTDFIKFPSWPAFNVADCTLTCGALIMGLALLFQRAPAFEPPAAPTEAAVPAELDRGGQA